MAQYIKMTNGPIKVLVDVKDVATLNDKMEDGFYAELDKNGDVILVDSTSLVKSDNDAVNEILNMVKAKQVKSTKTKRSSRKSW
jgi:hypothetical protein